MRLTLSALALGAAVAVAGCREDSAATNGHGTSPTSTDGGVPADGDASLSGRPDDETADAGASEGSSGDETGGTGDPPDVFDCREGKGDPIPTCTQPDVQTCPVLFQPRRGFYDDPLSVALTSDSADATIHYTLDGSIPTPRSPVYDGPIAIDTTNVVRAIAVTAGLEDSAVFTHSYIFVDDVINQAEPNGYPTGTRSESRGTMRYDYAMDTDVGPAPQVREGLLSLPSLSIAAAPGELFASVGHWPPEEELVASFEMLHPGESDSDWAVTAGLEHHSPWHSPKESARVNFRSAYGPGKLYKPVMRTAVHHACSATNRFDKLILRAGGTEAFLPNNANPDANFEKSGRNCTYVRDQWYRDTAIALSGVGSRGVFVHLYVNGIYFGLYNVAERPDAGFAESYFGGSKDDYFARSHGAEQGDDPQRYNAAINPTSYAEVEELVDLPLFIDYLVLNWYLGNTDFTERNWWSHIRNTPPGKFRILAWDGELTWGLWSYAPEIQQPQITIGGIWPTIWNTSRDEPEFRIAFADRVYRACFHDGALTAAQSVARYEALRDEVEPAILPELRRWANNGVDGPLRTKTEWESQNERVIAMMEDQCERFLIELGDLWPGTLPPDVSSPDAIVETSALTVAAGTPLTLAAPTGEIYVTLSPAAADDGADPRAPGGDAAGMLVSSGEAIVIDTDTIVRARTLDGETWSPKRELTVTVQ